MQIHIDAAGQTVGGISEEFPLMHINPRYHIGIDPDIKFNGFAVYEKRLKKLLVCTSFKYFEILKVLKVYRQQYIDHQIPFLIHIEGGWLVAKSNFHEETKQYVREKIAKNVGSNHEAGRKLVEMCEEYDFPFVVRYPIKPKFADERMFKMITGWKEQTNLDSRSAANYVYGY